MSVKISELENLLQRIRGWEENAIKDGNKHSQLSEISFEKARAYQNAADEVKELIAEEKRLEKEKSELYPNE